MKKFTIRIEELLQKDIVIKAIDKDDAMSKVQEMYGQADIVLDENDFFEVNFSHVDTKDKK